MANEVLNSRGNSEPGRVLPQPVAPELASDLVAEFRNIPILADLSDEGCAAIAVAPHPSVPVIDECARDQIERGVGFQREPRPFA